MRTIWLGRPGGPSPVGRLGQDFGSLLNIGLELAKGAATWYAAKRASDQAKQQKERSEQQLKDIEAAKAAAEAKRAEDAKKAQEAQQAAQTPGSKILGIDSTSFYVGAGVLGVGALALLLLRK